MKYSDNINDGIYAPISNDLSGSKSLIDSIVKDLTPSRLQRAIILSEIVGKPKSKTRKRRRF